MVAIGLLLIRMLCDFFKPRPRLEAEILILRHQLNVLQRARHAVDCICVGPTAPCSSGSIVATLGSSRDDRGGRRDRAAWPCLSLQRDHSSLHDEPPRGGSASRRAVGRGPQVPGADQAKVEELAAKAKADCPDCACGRGPWRTTP